MKTTNKKVVQLSEYKTKKTTSEFTISRPAGNFEIIEKQLKAQSKNFLCLFTKNEFTEEV